MYRYLHPQKYSIGITQVLLNETHPILIATAEKALADKIVLSSSKVDLQNTPQARAFLFDDLRLDEMGILALDHDHLAQIVTRYQNINLQWVQTAIQEMKH